MSWQNTVIVVSLVGTALMPVMIIAQIRSLAHSRSRNRLWKIRDDLVDRLLRGGIEPSQSASRLLQVIEVHIRVVGRHTLVDALMATVLVRGQAISPLTDEILADDLRPADRKQLAELLAGFQRAVGDHLLAGSPSGWLALVVVKVYKIAFRLRHRSRPPTRHKDLREQVEIVDINKMPDLLPPKSSVHGRGPVLAGPNA